MDIITFVVRWVLDDEPSDDDVRGLVRSLLDHGYTLHEIDAALTITFALPDILLARNHQSPVTSQAVRVFSLSERSKIDVSAQGYLLKLLDQGFLTPSELEEVVNAAMSLDVEEVGISELRWLLPRVLQDAVRSALLASGSQSNQPH